MTYSQLTKVRGFLLLMFVLILISGCTEKFNPEIHICDEVIDMYPGYFGDEVVRRLGGVDKFEINYNRKYETNTLYGCRYVEGIFGEEVFSCFYCKDDEFRDKNECELENPNYIWVEGCPDYKCSCEMPDNQTLCEKVLEICGKQSTKLPKRQICIEIPEVRSADSSQD